MAQLFSLGVSITRYELTKPCRCCPAPDGVGFLAASCRPVDATDDALLGIVSAFAD